MEGNPTHIPSIWVGYPHHDGGGPPFQSTPAGSQVGTQHSRHRPTPADQVGEKAQVEGLYRHVSTPGARLRIRRLGVRIPPSALSNDTSVCVAMSTDHGSTWTCSGPVSTPEQAVYPWIVATSAGEDLVYYGTA